MAATSCVLCHWVYDPGAVPVAAYLPGKVIPLKWTDSGPGLVHPTDLVGTTIPQVALCAHWAQEHPKLLHGFLADFEIDYFPRDGALAAQAGH
jgi:hypothetical protein